ncbi:MAG: hypothetical protein ACJ72N_07060 [Labedaea sp.]
MTVTRFQQIKHWAQKRLPCTVCGKKLTRKTTLWQTLNPWNKNAAGEPKTVAEIRDELKAQAADWMVEPITCRQCSGAVAP